MRNVTTSDSLFVYRLMQSIPLSNKYSYKILALCFAGTHIPLLVSVGYRFGIGGPGAITPDQGADLAVLLAATLLATAFTLLIVHWALAPVTLATRALQAYRAGRVLPDLPVSYRDEAGQLMSAVQAVTHELEATLREQEVLATTDALSGLANRRAFFSGANRALTAARCEGRPLALVLVDIDRFKGINDTFGHAAGDEVIAGLGRLLRGLARPGEVAARLGGEEFALLVPGASRDDALARAEELRREASRLTFAGMRHEPVTVSVGVAVLMPGDVVVDHLLDRADNALYASKRSGRNRVTLAA